MENSFDDPWKASAEDIAYALQCVGLSFETNARIVRPRVLDGETVKEFKVDGVNPQLGMVILSYRTKIYPAIESQQKTFGFTKSIRSFCESVRSGTARVVSGEVALNAK